MDVVAEDFPKMLIRYGLWVAGVVMEIIWLADAHFYSGLEKWQTVIQCYILYFLRGGENKTAVLWYTSLYFYSCSLITFFKGHKIYVSNIS